MAPQTGAGPGVLEEQDLDFYIRHQLAHLADAN
jgi:hypothetical protein